MTIECPKSQTRNPDIAKFRGECSTLLPNLTIRTK